MEGHGIDVALNRGDALAAIRARVSTKVGGWLKDDECVQLVLACGTRQWENVVSYLFARKVLSAVKAEGVNTFAITLDEWSVLFGPLAVPSKLSVPNFAVTMEDKVVKSSLLDIASTLRCTLAEPTQQKAWTRPWTQLVVYTGTHMQKDEEYVCSALGNLVRADSRRVEDLRSRVDEGVENTMILGDAITILALTVT